MNSSTDAIDIVTDSDNQERNTEKKRSMFSRSKHYIFIGLFGALNLLISSPVQLIEVFNEKLRVAAYLKNSLEYSECMGPRSDNYNSTASLFCWDKYLDKTSEFSYKMIDDYEKTLWLTSSSSSRELTDILFRLNGIGTSLIFMGGLLGYFLCLVFSKVFKKHPKCVNTAFAASIAAASAAIFFYSSTIMDSRVNRSEIESALSFLIYLRGLLGMNISFFSYYISINSSKIFGKGKSKNTRIAQFGAVQTISGSLAFTVPILFNWIYFNGSWLAFNAFTLSMFGLSLVIVLLLNYLLAIKSSEQEHNYELQNMLSVEDEKKVEVVCRESTSDLFNGEEEVKPRLSHRILSSLKKNVGRFFKWYPVILVFYPVLFFMTGANLFLYHKDVILHSTAGIASAVFLSSPLMGGVLMLTVFTKMKQGKLAVYGFGVTTILEIFFYLVNQSILSEGITSTLSVAVSSLILICINCTLAPLLGTLPFYIRHDSPSVIAIYGLMMQLSNLLCYIALSHLYSAVQFNFVLLSVVCCGLGVLSKRWLFKEYKERSLE
ncbi:hypothetical protein NEMIN01_1247 [Nematocida minor]|uniref:uncharacterized protein n=1 Tax=Nematocida minor TaxID=1912983 RepID=UPI00221F7481|nr:uncharacterized protein NEMIN01_1247 [Nematocida minor]KAI5190845.1 hypothetical protein NEMIN01_1247 [Nematocida minor]